MSAKNKKTGKIIVYILLLFILVGIVGFFAYFTKGFTGDLTTFYVECDNQKGMSSSNGFLLSANNPLDVSVHYTFGFISKDISGYSIEVLPTADFDFTVDGEVYSFAAEENLNAGFDIERNDKSFKISPKGNLQTILETLYPEKTIEYSKANVDFDAELFKIIISSKDGKSQVVMFCRIDDCAVSGVELDMEVIVF